MAASNKKTNVMAILGLIFAFVFSPLGLVFSIIAKKQIKTTKEEGAGLATAGLVISIIGTVFWVIWIIMMIVLASTATVMVNELNSGLNDYYNSLESLY